MTKIIKYILFVLILFGQGLSMEAQRFPKPEFESGHTQPLIQKPEPRSTNMEYVDLFVLFASLCFASWLVLKRRSRKGILYLAVFSLIYFGFIREGCICSVGSDLRAIFNGSWQ